VGAVLDWVQPAADRVPLLASALHVARTEGLQVLDDLFTGPERHRSEEAQSLELPDAVVATGKALLRGGQQGLYQGFFETRILGRAHIPQHTNFLVAANHASHLDMGLVKHALGGQGENLAALAARDYFFSDRWRRTYFENFTQLIPMDRHGSLRESLELASRTLRQGRNLLIFPEGTRATDGELKEFKGSLGYLALTNRVGILPMYLDGTYEALPKGAVVPKNRKLTVRIAPFLSFEELQRMVEGLPRSEQHREVARWVEGTIRALRDGRRPPGVGKEPPVADATDAAREEAGAGPAREETEATADESVTPPWEREA
jgi:1-acyl-sn-glycerol-3-phosphate acyltransferase